MDIYYRLLIIGIFPLLSFSLPAALSAYTAQVIIGNKPQVINTDKIGANLSFTVSGKTYKAGNNSYSNALLLPIGSKISDFTINQLQASDFVIADNYLDSDGDMITDTSLFANKNFQYRWLDRDGTLIPFSSYTQAIGGCSTTVKTPLTLEISASVSVSSNYGIPRQSDWVDVKQNYKIQSPATVCFLKPNSLEWVGSTDWGMGTETPSAGRGGGYNNKTFSKNNGFFSTAGFPTTGFKGAQFQLVMDGNDYTYTVLSGSGVTVNATTGLVTLNSKPTSTVVIKAQDNTLASRFVNYSFNIKNWVVPNPTPGTYENLSASCGGASNIPDVKILTNSPQNTLTSNPIPENYYTRDVGTVFSEWGQTIYQKYKTSYWQAEYSNVPYYLPKTSGNYRYAVSSLSGPIIFTDVNATTGYIVCKG